MNKKTSKTLFEINNILDKILKCVCKSNKNCAKCIILRSKIPHLSKKIEVLKYAYLKAKSKEKRKYEK